MTGYRGYMIPETAEEIRGRVFHEHWAGDWLVVKPVHGDASKIIYIGYDRGALDRKDLDAAAVAARCRSAVDRQLSEGLPPLI